VERGLLALEREHVRLEARRVDVVPARPDYHQVRYGELYGGIGSYREL